MATTLAAIRDRIKVVIEAATPTAQPIQELYRYKPRGPHSLQEWAATCPSSCLRAFSIIRIGDTNDRPGQLEPEVLVDEQAILTVAYPKLVDIYGEGYESMEDCLRADARQLSGLVLSGSTWSAVSGWSGVSLSTIAEPVREGAVWFQSLTFNLLYCESQTLT